MAFESEIRLSLEIVLSELADFVATPPALGCFIGVNCIANCLF